MCVKLLILNQANGLTNQNSLPCRGVNRPDRILARLLLCYVHAHAAGPSHAKLPSTDPGSKSREATAGIVRHPHELGIHPATSCNLRYPYSNR